MLSLLFEIAAFLLMPGHTFLSGDSQQEGSRVSSQRRELQMRLPGSVLSCWVTSSGFVSLITIKNKLNFLGKRRHSDSPRINTCNDLFRENKSLPYSVWAQKRRRAAPLKPEGVTHGDLGKGRFGSTRSGLEDPRSHSEEQGTRGFS